MSRGRPTLKTEKKTKYILEFGNMRYHFDDIKSKNGAYLVEDLDPTYDKLEKLNIKLDKLKEPQYHINGRKKRTTKADKIKMETTERAYWKEYYKHFPEDKPKKRGRKKKKNK